MISHDLALSTVTWAQWSSTCTVQSSISSHRNCCPAIWPSTRRIVSPVLLIAVYMAFCSAVIGIAGAGAVVLRRWRTVAIQYRYCMAPSKMI